MLLLTLLSWHSWRCFFTFTTFQAVWSMFCWLLSGLCWQCHCFDITVSAVLSVVLFSVIIDMRCLFAEILWLPAIALCWTRHECYPFFWVWMSLYIKVHWYYPVIQSQTLSMLQYLRDVWCMFDFYKCFSFYLYLTFFCFVEMLIYLFIYQNLM